LSFLPSSQLGKAAPDVGVELFGVATMDL